MVYHGHMDRQKKGYIEVGATYKGSIILSQL